LARPPAFTLPARCSVRHPAYLPASLRRQIRRRFDPRGIFLNIPYAPRCTRLELAIVSTATAYGLRPVLAKQQVVFSYEKRMNMPFELGIMIALGKDCFVVSQRRYSGLASISDLNLGDIHYHECDPLALIGAFSRWIESNCSRRRLAHRLLAERYAAFVRLRRAVGQDDFDRLTLQEIDTALMGARRILLGVRIVGRG
jgi:hypothetical protein